MYIPILRTVPYLKKIDNCEINSKAYLVVLKKLVVLRSHYSLCWNLYIYMYYNNDQNNTKEQTHHINLHKQPTPENLMGNIKEKNRCICHLRHDWQAG